MMFHKVHRGPCTPAPQPRSVPSINRSSVLWTGYVDKQLILVRWAAEAAQAMAFMSANIIMQSQNGCSDKDDHDWFPTPEILFTVPEVSPLFCPIHFSSQPYLCVLHTASCLLTVEYCSKCEDHLRLTLCSLMCTAFCPNASFLQMEPLIDGLRHSKHHPVCNNASPVALWFAVSIWNYSVIMKCKCSWFWHEIELLQCNNLSTGKSSPWSLVAELINLGAMMRKGRQQILLPLLIDEISQWSPTPQCNKSVCLIKQEISVLHRW